MGQNMKLKIFISYSHEDTSVIERFRKHLSPLKDNGLVEDWYDRKIMPSEDYEEKIDNNLDDTDIICLFISASFLDSENCKKEKIKALKLNRCKQIPVIPIILSDCGWQDVKDISKLLALPTDGKPISNFSNQDSGWKDVYDGLKKVIEKELQYRQLNISSEFQNFLQSTEMLLHAHSQKESVLLNNIFIYPEMDKFDEFKQYDETISSEELIKNLFEFHKIAIVGEDQSGKTTLCKNLFLRLRDMNLIPIYINDKDNRLRGRMEQIIERFYKKQYDGIDFSNINKDRIIPIIDDFHYTKNKEKQIQKLADYPFTIIIVDDIFNLNIADENVLYKYTLFQIKELKPSIRDRLIRKWISLSDKEEGASSYALELDLYPNLDKATELINTTLGKVFGSGIMPSYPFHILTILSTYETLAKPLNQEITSQGYCYQALIYIYLRKQNVKNEDIDTYINFLSEFAYHFYINKISEITKDEFSSFMEEYVIKYNLPIKPDVLLRKLNRVQIIGINSFNNLFFNHLYLYYYFVGKYLADHIEENIEEINRIIKNLHVDENAYILIFLSHHSKNPRIIQDIINYARQLYANNQPARLTKTDCKFFDEQADNIVEALLPPSNISPEKEREDRLRIQDKFEEKNNNENNNAIETEEIEIEIRRTIKTVEVMGQIIKNRAGSLERIQLEELFIEAMNVNLRLLSEFINIIKDENNQREIILFIKKRLEMISEIQEEKLSREDVEKISRKIFWNINFFTMFGIIDKTVHSIGSDKIVSIVERCCEKENYPSTFLIKHGILLHYYKNPQIDNLSRAISDDHYSKMAKRILKFMIVNHCYLHPIKRRDRQRIEQKIGISSMKLLRFGLRNKT